MENINTELQRIDNNLQVKFDELVDQEKVYQNLEQRHIDIGDQVEKSRREQLELDENVQGLNDQWLSKRMRITHDTATIKELRQNISDVKIKRQERLEKEKNRVENEVVQNRNYNTNVYARR